MSRLSFDLGEIGIFWLYFHFRQSKDQEKAGALMPVEGLFLSPASIQAQTIVKGICRNGTVTKENILERNHWDMDVTEEIRGDLGFVKHNVHCNDVF